MREMEKYLALIASDHPGVIPGIQFVDYTLVGRPPGVLEHRLKLAPRRLPGYSPAVLVIPVPMTEAWLLLDESAIRRAAGKPAGRACCAKPCQRRVDLAGDLSGTPVPDSTRVAY